jgi:hypothetical protein
VQEIQDIKTNETMIHPSQKKTQALYMLEIELKDQYGNIALSIA